MTMTSAALAAREVHGGDTVGGLPDDGHVVLRVQHHAEPGPDQFLIVDERDPDRHAAPRPARPACPARSAGPGSAGTVNGSVAVTW